MTEPQYSAEEKTIGPALLASGKPIIKPDAEPFNEFKNYMIHFSNTVYEVNHPTSDSQANTIRDIFKQLFKGEKIKRGSHLITDIITLILLLPIMVVNEYRSIVAVLFLLMIFIIYITCKKDYGLYVIITQVGLWLAFLSTGFFMHKPDYSMFTMETLKIPANYSTIPIQQSIQNNMQAEHDANKDKVVALNGGIGIISKIISAFTSELFSALNSK
jgi:hypothetical protein